MSSARERPRCFCIYPLLEEQQFFVKMIDGRAIILHICFFRLMHDGFLSWGINRAAFVSAIRKGTSNADSSERVQSISVLNNFTFKRRHGSLNSSTFERHIRNNFANMIGNLLWNGKLFEYLPRHFWADSTISIMKFPIRDIM